MLKCTSGQLQPDVPGETQKPPSQPVVTQEATSNQSAPEEFVLHVKGKEKNLKDLVELVVDLKHSGKKQLVSYLRALNTITLSTYHYL